MKAAARAEAAHGALAGYDPGLYVNLGTGLAAAIVSNGAVVLGAHGAAGEIGYNLRNVGIAPDAPRLEEAVSGKALATAAADLFDGADVAALFAQVRDRRAVAKQVCAEFLDELAYHLVNLAIAIDPARVVVGGGMTRSWDRHSSDAGTCPVRRRCRSRPSSSSAPTRSTRRSSAPWISPRRLPETHGQSERLPVAKEHQHEPTVSHRRRRCRSTRPSPRHVSLLGLGEEASLGDGRRAGRHLVGGEQRGRDPQEGRRRSRSPTSRARRGRASSTPSTRPCNRSRSGFVYEPLVFVNILRNAEEKPMLAKSYTWGAGQEVDRVHHPQTACSGTTASRSPRRTSRSPST